MYEQRRAGQKYGDLTVLGTRMSQGDSVWYSCICVCGAMRAVEERRLLRGMVTMCTFCEMKLNWQALNKESA